MPQRPGTKRIGFRVLLLILLLLLIVWSFPWALRTTVTRALEKATGLDVTLSRLSFKRPSDLEFKDLRFFWKGKERVSIETVTLSLRLKTLFSKTIQVDRISLEGLSVRLVRRPDGSLDLFHFFRKGPLPPISSPKRTFVIQSVSVTKGEVELSDETVGGGPYTLRFVDTELTARPLSFPLQDRQSLLIFHTFLSAEALPPSGLLQVDGWVNGRRGDLQWNVALREVDLTLWNPYTARFIPMGVERGRMDLDGEFQIVQGQLDGVGLIRIRDLLLRRSPTTGFLETFFGVSQDQLIAFLGDSEGEMVFPIKVSGRLDDPKFELGELVAKSIRQNLARTVQKGVGGMMRVGSETLGIADLEKRVKRLSKEVQKTFRLDWLFTP